ncbi:hypothetical protein JB92DRAFT_2860120 [Gautieria morchelliformis]|nr:hypothetical protein JB92DRAFT_2860120 [Gautieria morchelliformis]
MPTSTETLTVPAAPKVSKLPVSAKQSASSNSAVATLRSLYPRAARAFLQRDVTLTYSLLLSAFSNLQPPVSSSSLDILSSHRRKWDILRITLETTLCASAPHQETLPPPLHLVLQLSPPSLISMMHVRSLQLFTPANRGKPNAEFLPSQILVTLVLASIKLGCAQVGREMIEDWLSLRNHSGAENNRDQKRAKDDAEGYEKVLETYCLHVLPRLEDWEYAREFLRYECELPQDRRMYLAQSLQVLHTQHLARVEELRERERNVALSPSSSRTPTPRPLNGRTPSPSPSMTSTSTTSTHTAVPLAPRPHASPSRTFLTPAPRSHSPAPSRPSSAATTTRPARTATPLPTPPSAPQPQMPVAIPTPSLLALLRAALPPHLTQSRLAFLVVMFLVPVVSYVFRLRRRRLRLLCDAGSAVVVSRPRGGAAEEARRRLEAGWWAEIRRVVADTLRMAAGGLA